MPPEYFLAHLWLVPLFPLAASAVMLLFGRHLSKSAVNVFCVGGVFLSMVYAFGAILQLLARPVSQRVVEYVLFDWLPAGAMHTTAGVLTRFDAQWGYLFDPLTVVMLGVVTGVGFLIHVYSVGYMAHEGGYYRFFGYLNLFMFSMLTLVLANNILEMFVGWEGVGLCSYLLIGFYFHKKSATDAGKKAFIVNRIGDTGFILGVFLMAATLGTINFTGLRMAIFLGGFHRGDAALTAIAFLLFVGATGKSAQLPLYVWLPDAMEGPTPVSALIHAATMVTAGVYMVVRTSAIFSMAPLALEVMAGIGAATAIFAASIGVLQTDIKKVLAYSTISQLGYMFLACGVGAFSAGIFHLMTHAFFKGLLFLAAGSVIHAMSGEQDMLKMGALSKKIPTTYRTMLIATLAIAGIPPFAGFFSKDEILGRSFGVSHLLWLVGWITAGLTAFYMFRLLFLTFHGESRVSAEAEHHLHESPPSMTVPLVILALLSIVGGWVGIGGHFEKFLAPVVSPRPFGLLTERPGSPANLSLKASAVEAPAAPAEAEKEAGEAPPESLLMILAVGGALVGIGLAWFLYLKRTDLPAKIAASAGGLYRLVYEKYYVDQIYDAMFVNRAKDLGLALGAFDRIFIDGLFINGAGRLTRVTSVISAWWDKWFIDGLLNLGARIFWLISYPVRMLQTGRVGSYALLIVVGMLVFLGYYLHAAGFTMANLWH
ncbi:MAG: NADH-quinone oxidoreductase subunit L [Candidatus Acidiferrales bacterium]